ncbi:bifunctional deaminase-reductase domain-containing protein [Dendryphion nanum]|uniref:2,5-diamino-6-ribosylamino-4(3H)-pyrimidinone 5'-phosphate reductase n=1 Tax=Dendryphion nanum TaxID=256645 RepID=A0A9P9D5R3_9PLEO|nr:bifunctional deaminase-reductase domain-containing protein [Dendryphion nanum]
MVLLRYNAAISLDGFIASANHTTPWIIEDPTIDFPALFSTFSTFLMGRKTYSTMLSFGDSNPLRDKQRDEMIVVSSTMEPRDHPDITIVEAYTVDFVKKLKKRNEEQGKKDIWLFGGGELAGLMFKEGLVDRVEVAVMPVLVGEGIKFADGRSWGGAAKDLKLVSVEKLDSGILMCVYDVQN